MEKAHPFTGMLQVNLNAAGVDIGAVEIVVCVSGNEKTQIVRHLGTTAVTLIGLAGSLEDRNPG
jgi:hypothetical protein